MTDDINLEQIKEKLYRALKQKAVLAERSRLLSQQIEDLKQREDQNDHVVNELLDRQREMNYMLHLANSFVHRIQETNAILSTEFTELVKELPAPENPDWEERVKKINDLFKKTGEMAEELEVEVFKRRIDEDQAPKSEPAKSVDVPVPSTKFEPESQPEPEIIQQAEPEPLAAEVIKDHTEEIIDTPEVEPGETVLSEISDDGSEDQELTDKLEQLFGKTRLEPSDPLVSGLDEKGKSKQKKTGIFARLFRKKRGGPDNNNNGNPDKDSSDDVSAPVESVPEVEPLVEEQAPVECCETPKQLETSYYAEVFNQTASEFDIISYGYPEVPGDPIEAVEPVSDAPKPGFLRRMFQEFQTRRQIRVLLAIERERERRANLRNKRKRTGPPKHGDSAPIAGI